MGIISGLLGIFLLILWIRVIFSWILPPHQRGWLADVNRVVFVVTEPALAPLRRLLPMVRAGGMGIDLSPWVLMVIIYVVRSLL